MSRIVFARLILTGIFLALLNGVVFAAVNIAPTITQPSPLPSGSPNTTIGIANNIQITDPDAGAGNLTLTVTATNGAFRWQYSFIPNVTAQTTDTATDILSDLNSALDGLVFIPAPGFAGTASLLLTVNDNGNTGTGGAKSDTLQFAITVCTPAEIGNPTACQTNNGPVNSVTSPLNTDLVTPINVSTSVSDPDVGGGTMEMEVNVAHHSPLNGSFTPDRVGTFTWAYGTSVTSDAIIDNLADLNTALSGLIFTPAQSFAGQARIVYEIDDQANSDNNPLNDDDPDAALADTDFVVIDICIASEMGNLLACETNNPPVNNLPNPVPDTTVNTPVAVPVSVSDVDVGMGNMQMEINVAHHNGALPPAQVGTITWAYGTNVTSDSATDSMADINDALADLIFTPAAGFTGQARIVFEIDDRGNSGSDTIDLEDIIKADTDFVVIDVTQPANTTFSTTMQGHPPAPNTALQQTVAVLITRAGVAEPIFDGTRTTNTSGQFAVNNLPPGTYRIRVKGEHSLSSAQDITLAVGSNAITITDPLREGDASGNNIVDLTDFSLLAAAFNTVPGNANYNANADFNDDNTVQLIDFSLLVSNFNQAGAN